MEKLFFPAIISIILLSFLQVSFAETTTIEARHDKTHIVITITDDSYNLKLWSESGFSEYTFDSEDVKRYNNTERFSLRNSDVRLLAFPAQEATWKLFIITFSPYERIFIKDALEQIEFSLSATDRIEMTDNSTAANKTANPSVGRDISRWDIPTTGRPNHKIVIEETPHDPDSLRLITRVPHSVEYKHTLAFDITAIDTQIASENDRRMSGVTIYATILDPMGKVYKTWKGVTNHIGGFEESILIPDNEVIGQYTLETVAFHANYNSTVSTDNFFVMPLDSNGSTPEPKCNESHFWNSTTTSCEPLIISTTGCKSDDNTICIQ